MANTDLILWFLPIIIVIAFFWLVKRDPKIKKWWMRFSFKDGSFDLGAERDLTVENVQTIEDGKRRIEKDLGVPQDRIHYENILIPQGVIILGISKKDREDWATASLKANIQVPFQKDTKIILFVDGTNGRQNTSKFLRLDDTVEIGLSDDGATSKIIFGPRSVKEILKL